MGQSLQREGIDVQQEMAKWAAWAQVGGSALEAAGYYAGAKK